MISCTLHRTEKYFLVLKNASVSKKRRKNVVFLRVKNTLSGWGLETNNGWITRSRSVFKRQAEWLFIEVSCKIFDDEQFVLKLLLTQVQKFRKVLLFKASQ